VWETGGFLLLCDEQQLSFKDDDEASKATRSKKKLCCISLGEGSLATQNTRQKIHGQVQLCDEQQVTCNDDDGDDDGGDDEASNKKPKALECCYLGLGEDLLHKLRQRNPWPGIAVVWKTWCWRSLAHWLMG
jgi:hypothetical protein